MLSKVLKNLKKVEKKTSADLDISFGGYKPQKTTKDGFRAKVNSEAGALRQRSMGNRMSKPSRSK